MKKLLATTMVVTVLLLQSMPAGAVVRTWTGATDDDWWTMTNWDPSTGTIASSDDLTIESGQPTSDGAAVTTDGGGSISLANYNTSATVGDLTVGDLGAGTLVIDDKASVSCANACIAAQPGSTGSATVKRTHGSDSFPSRWQCSGSLYVGGNASGPGGTGTLTVQDYANIYIAGTLRVYSKGTVQRTRGCIFADEVDVTGAASHLHDTEGSTLMVNTLTGFGDHPAFNGSLCFGYDFGVPNTQAGHTVGNGQSLTVGNGLIVGRNASATLTIADGGTVTSGRCDIGFGCSSEATVEVTGPGSRWTNGRLWVGCGNERGLATLRITGGASVSNTDCFIAYTMMGMPGIANGRVIVSGAGSTWTIDDLLQVGMEMGGGMPTATLTVEDGGLVKVAGWLSINNMGACEVNLNEGTIETGSFRRYGGTFNWTAGTVRFTDGLTVDTDKPFGDTVNLTAGQTLDVVGTLDVGSGGTVGLYLGGVLAADTIVHNAGGTFNVVGGRLTVGTFEGDLDNDRGTLVPGSSPGLTEVVGNYTQGELARLEIELFGADPEQYDRLHVTGTVSLSGTLEVILADGFIPRAGDTFDILDWGTLDGTFDLVMLPGGLSWDSSALYETGQITLRIPGDANGDKKVNDEDASILAAHWQDTGTSWGDGDFNDDGVVNHEDASILAAHWQEAVSEGAAPVPEPGTTVLLIVGGFTMLLLRLVRNRL